MTDCKYSTIVFVFYAQIIGGELRSSFEGKPSWLDKSEVLTKMSAFHHTMLHDYIEFRLRCTKYYQAPSTLHLSLYDAANVDNESSDHSYNPSSS